MSDQDDSEQPSRKGRSNAILTYETVAAIERGLIDVSNKIDNVAEKVTDMRAVHTDHEVRIKALELAQAATVAAGSASSQVWLWVWGAAVALPPVLIAIFEKLLS